MASRLMLGNRCAAFKMRRYSRSTWAGLAPDMAAPRAAPASLAGPQLLLPGVTLLQRLHLCGI